ncbi:hypothetical protein GFL93_12610 [Rhizobium leguminosarum bv. viciae]|uniref:hypothetical protein n=1 Tax=Rhizobium TaxID=379 RepID=UPI0014429DA6|nr:hypothetical protein [Rhizobium leguminosarum]NKK06702.1 hypothetical protein [Rhizobium leguminosarum bv. viciae]
MSDHERIYLEPSPGADEDYGRQWCQHNVWDDATEYVRADLHAALVEERDRLREALQKAETVIDLMADVVTYDATMQGPKILGVNGSAARRASEAARDYLIAKDRVKP